MFRLLIIIIYTYCKLFALTINVLYTFAMSIRQTKTKLAVVDFFQASTKPQTLSEAYTHICISIPKIAYSTVYRIVQTLVDDGKLISLDWKDRSGRFEWADRQHHHHALCNSCGVVQDIADSELKFNETLVAKKIGFKIQSHTIELKGICNSCQPKYV